MDNSWADPMVRNGYEVESAHNTRVTYLDTRKEKSQMPTYSKQGLYLIDTNNTTQTFLRYLYSASVRSFNNSLPSKICVQYNNFKV